MQKFATFLIIILLSANALGRAISDYGVQLGSTTRQTIERLGQPSLQGQLNGYTVYGYCLQAGFKVDGQTLIFENDRLVWSQGFKTRCGNNFRLSEIDWAKVAREKLVTEIKEEYLIDNLKITVITNNLPNTCFKGNKYQVNINGMIGPDSSFAMEEILAILGHCKDRFGKVLHHTKVFLDSGGGFLDHGYQLGRIFRSRGVHTVIDEGMSCASSCAVAFLGGGKRSLRGNGTILFHAPYYSKKNSTGQRDPDCDVGKNTLDEMKNYYIEMTDPVSGERLFERTMWYCSAEDGWTVSGAPAAKLYKIAIES